MTARPGLSRSAFCALPNANNIGAFCFIDQSTAGQTRSLYVKDERTTGSAFSTAPIHTLTIFMLPTGSAIEEQRLSPGLFVSPPGFFHAPSLRCAAACCQFPGPCCCSTSWAVCRRRRLQIHAQVVSARALNEVKACSAAQGIGRFAAEPLAAVLLGPPGGGGPGFYLGGVLAGGADTVSDPDQDFRLCPSTGLRQRARH